MPNADEHKLQAEQQMLDRAHDCLEAMQGRTEAAREVSDRAVRDENTVDARIAQWHLRKRESDLQAGSGPLCFGRIEEEGYGPTAGDVWYVGRRHVEDADGQPVILDWRAPVSAAFYRATSVDPCGLVHRRRFSIDDRTVVAIFDEDLTDPESGGGGGLPDPLLAELDRARSGQMRDIVATIAAEQDEIIRADLEELLIVQGGPGTGKTAVGLHRAAYLLFQHRELLADTQILVVGPNTVFLRYIAEVLPSLGETSVIQTTAPALLGSRFRVRAADDDAVTMLKGDLRMAAVIEQSIRSRISVPSEGVELRSGINVVRLDRSEVEQLQKTALARTLPSNDARDVFRQMLLQEAWRRHAQRSGVDTGTQPAFTRSLQSDATFKKDLDKMWPTLSAAVIVRELLGSAKRLATAADGLLTSDEQALLRRKPSSKLADEQWTAADMGLLDEAVFLTTGVATTYGHVVVDEAQDLSAMALRMLRRRARAGSMTVLGDLAQATSVVAPGSWELALNAMGHTLDEERVRMAELTVGYRVPASILDVANRLLPEAAPEVTPARSVRPGGALPLVVDVGDHDMGPAVIAEIEALREKTSSVAVVGVGSDLDEIEIVMTQAEIPFERIGRRGLPGADAVALVSPEQVKGLEFDAVVVIEPSAIAALPNGLRHLYVSLTRAVQHLGIVHREPLPAALLDPRPEA